MSVATISESYPDAVDGYIGVTPALESLTDDLSVERSCLLPTQHRVEGICVIQDWDIGLSDGSSYRTQVFCPDNPKFEDALTYTTPLLTRLEGFNTFVGVEAARNGMFAVAVSSEQVGLARAIGNFGKTTLDHDVKAHVAILGSLAPAGNYNPDEYMLTGFSRGAMISFGILDEAENAGISIFYDDALDPCLHDPLSFKDLRPNRLFRYVRSELRDLSAAIGGSSLHDLRHLLRTPDILPPGVIQEVSTLLALLSGETGELLDRAPRDSLMRVVHMEDSGFNHASSYRNKLKNEFPLAVTVTQPGSHCEGAKREVQLSTVGRVALVQSMRAEGATKQEVFWALAA